MHNWDSLLMVNSRHGPEMLYQLSTSEILNWNMCNSVLLHVHVIPGAIAVGSQLFGEDTLPIHITDISCSGTEQVLLNCTHNTMSGYTCSTQRNDAGAVCQGDC